jgi:hypothetical protein
MLTIYPSRWILQVDQRQGDWYVGCMAGPPLPSHNVSAKKLRSKAWFICEEGFAYGGCCASQTLDPKVRSKAWFICEEVFAFGGCCASQTLDPKR